MTKVLGLDLGTNSIGWGYIDQEKNTIIDMGSHIFPEGVENLGDGTNEVSRNATRTAARGVRRQFFRKRLRKKYLLKILSSHGMCPLDHAQIKIWNTEALANNEAYKNWVKMNPYELRAKALTEMLTLEELGRICYHLIQRRGFQSNSRSASSDEDGAIFKGNNKTGKIGILETQEKMEDTTLGHYLNQLHPKEGTPYKADQERIRNRYTTRQMYITEFEKIWDVQSKLNPSLPVELKSLLGGRKKDGYDMDGALFHQRPLRSQKHLIGKCTFEPSKPKCPISAIPFELFRIYQWVNGVECNLEKLDGHDRAKLVSELLKKEKVSFSALRKAMGKQDAYYQFNYKDDDKIVGSSTISRLSSKKYLGELWDTYSDREKEEIWHVLFFFDDKDKLKKYALEKWGLKELQAENISNFHLREGYASLSRKAINNILPFLKLGYTYDVATVLGGIKNCFGEQWASLSEENKNLIIDNVPDLIRKKAKGGFMEPLKRFLKSEFQLSDSRLKKLYHHSTNISGTVTLDLLPVGADADREIQSIRNPVVISALFEVRKLVNEIIDRYGKPEVIKIELARDLKASKGKRNDTRNEQKRLERENDRVRDELNHLGIRVTHESLLKYKLWEECNKMCPYTGKAIPPSKLFTGEVQIEHIHPWSKSLNDSFMNKTLCYADENRLKGNKTPFEYYGAQGEEKWERVKHQALSCFKTKEHYPSAYFKFKHFVRKTHDNDFTHRQLNDTRYISKEAKNYLSKICNNVQVSPGQVTANLRHHWGLNNILDEEGGVKNRTDHRHHAIDALVMACTSVRFLQELTKWNKYDRNYDLKHFSKPWETFFEDAESTVAKILISHKRPNKILTVRKHKTKKGDQEYENTGVAARGQLHKETVYGQRTSPNSERAFHVRKSIESLTTLTQIQKVVDSRIKQLIIDHIESIGGFSDKGKVPDGAFFKTNEQDERIPQIHLPNKNGEPVPIMKVRIRENIGGAERLGENNQYVNPKNNHHVLIFKDAHGNMHEEVVTFWTAVERKKQNQAVVRLPEAYKDGSIVTTLKVNDLFILGASEKLIDWDNPNHAELSEKLFRVQKFTSGDYYFRRHQESTLSGKLGEAFHYIKNFGKGKTGWQSFNPIKVKITVTGKILRV